MEHLAALLNWFKARELEVRRLYARDDDFRCACEDFVVATNALFHWERDENNMVRAEEYRTLANEIEAEILSRLDAGLRRNGLEPNEGVRR